MVGMQPDDAAAFTHRDAALVVPDTAVSAAPDTNTETSEPTRLHFVKAGSALQLPSFDACLSI
jgi:hypothetical protein